MALAENTKVLMAKHGLTQRALAKAAGISQASVGYLLRYRDEHDRHAAVDTVESIARVLRVPGHMLLVSGYAAGEARNVQWLDARKAKSPHERRAEPTVNALDPALLEYIAELAISYKRGTAKQRASLVRSFYELVMSSEDRPTRASISRLIRSAQ